MPRGAVDALSLEVFKTRLDTPLSNPAEWNMSP